MSRFDFYEFVGVLAPGATFILAMSLLFEQIGTFLQKPTFSLGDLGVIVIISYVVGHLIQGAGNILEEIYWLIWGGKPTDWVRSNKHKLVSDGQIQELDIRLNENLKREKVSSIRELSPSSWSSIINEMYGSIKSADLDKRAYIFNGNYGLMRGVSAAIIIILATLLIRDPEIWKVGILLLVGLILAIFRMHRFGCYYAREVITSFLNISQEKQKIQKHEKE